MRKFQWAIICWLAAFGTARAQGPAIKLAGSLTPLQRSFSTSIRKTNVPVKVDGKLDESVWQEGNGITGFWRKFPTDGAPGARQTLVRITFDDKNLYVGAIAYDSGKAFIQTLKRDGGHDGSDGFAIVLDPLNQHTNGFFFVVNAFNSQSEDQLTTSDGPNFSWDHTWYSATSRHADHWVAEMAIPFKSLRYNSSQPFWGLNFVRIDTKTNEYSCWTKVPVNFASWDLGYTGALYWETPPPAAGSNIVLNPYVTGQVTSAQTNGSQQYNGKANAGFDAKVGLTSSLNLDLTVNPDFSQIEVDRQVTNLTRFNIFLPERRTFFLENADLFANYGMDPIRPFYSRRIGLDANNQTVPILAGARVTGSVTPSTRLGVLNMQTGNRGNYKAENFTAVSVNQRVLKRSSIRTYFLNRQGFLSEEEKRLNPLAAYGRNAGTEWVYTNTPGTVNVWGAVHKSFKPGIHNADLFWNGGFAVDKRRFNVVFDWVDVGTNYYTDMGFVQRIENYDALRDTTIRMGFKHFYNEMQYRIFPKDKAVNTMRLNMENFVVWNPDGSFNERNHTFNTNLQFNNTSNVFGGVQFNEVQLLYPISFTGGKPLPAANYRFWRYFAGYDADFRKPVAFGGRFSVGEFYGGQFTSLRGTLSWRHVPNFSLVLQAEYNRLKFPGDYGEGEILLIAPRIDVNFSTSIFWTTFLQYNTQANNFNINSRFQWRFRPMSDLYVVYTDNYFTDPLLKNKNRALVLKLNYWLNI